MSNGQKRAIFDILHWIVKQFLQDRNRARCAEVPERQHAPIDIVLGARCFDGIEDGVLCQRCPTLTEVIRDEPLCRFAIWKHHDVGLTYIGPADRLQLNRGLNTLRMSRASTVSLSLRHSYARIQRKSRSFDSGLGSRFSLPNSIRVRLRASSGAFADCPSSTQLTYNPVPFTLRTYRRHLSRYPIIEL